MDVRNIQFSILCYIKFFLNKSVGQFNKVTVMMDNYLTICTFMRDRHTFMMRCTFMMDRCTFMMHRCTFMMDRCIFMMNRCTFMMDRCTFMMDRCTFMDFKTEKAIHYHYKAWRSWAIFLI